MPAAWEAPISNLELFGELDYSSPLTEALVSEFVESPDSIDAIRRQYPEGIDPKELARRAIAEKRPVIAALAIYSAAAETTIERETRVTVRKTARSLRRRLDQDPEFRAWAANVMVSSLEAIADDGVEVARRQIRGRNRVLQDTGRYMLKIAERRNRLAANIRVAEGIPPRRAQ